MSNNNSPQLATFQAADHTNNQGSNSHFGASASGTNALEQSGIAPPVGLRMPQITGNWADESIYQQSTSTSNNNNNQNGTSSLLRTSSFPATRTNNNNNNNTSNINVIGSRDTSPQGNTNNINNNGVLNNPNFDSNEQSLSAHHHPSNSNSHDAQRRESLQALLGRVEKTNSQSGTPSSQGQGSSLPVGGTVPGAMPSPPPLTTFSSLAPRNHNNNNNNDQNAESLSIHSNQGNENNSNNQNNNTKTTTTTGTTIITGSADTQVPPAGGASTTDQHSLLLSHNTGNSTSAANLIQQIQQQQPSSVMDSFKNQLQQVVQVLPPLADHHNQQQQYGGGGGFGGRGGGRGGGGRGGGGGHYGQNDHNNQDNVGLTPAQEQQNRQVSAAINHMVGTGWNDIRSLRGHFLEFALDAEGSKMLQRMMNTSSAVEEAFPELAPAVAKLSCHPSGNYAVQRIIEYGSDTHRLLVVKSLRGCCLDFSEDVYGCRVLQRLMEVVFPMSADAGKITDKNGNNEKSLLAAEHFNSSGSVLSASTNTNWSLQQELIGLIQELDGNMVRVIKDQNGNHVAQRILERVSPLQYATGFVIDVFNHAMIELGQHCYGCRVAQKVFEVCHDGSNIHLQDNQDALDRMFGTVASSLPQLIYHQYGNYVVQHMIAHAPLRHRQKVLDALIPQLRDLACNKFGSNVVERLFMHADREVVEELQRQKQQQQEDNAENPQQQDQETTSGSNPQDDEKVYNEKRHELQKLMETILKPHHQEQGQGQEQQQQPILVDLMRDQFANYVVQKIIDNASPFHVLRQRLLTELRKHNEVIAQTTFGQHLLAKIDRAGWTDVENGGEPLLPSHIQLPYVAGAGGDHYRGGGRGGGFRGGARGGGGGDSYHNHNNNNYGGRGGYGNNNNNNISMPTPFSQQQNGMNKNYNNNNNNMNNNDFRGGRGGRGGGFRGGNNNNTNNNFNGNYNNNNYNNSNRGGFNNNNNNMNMNSNGGRNFRGGGRGGNYNNNNNFVGGYGNNGDNYNNNNDYNGGGNNQNSEMIAVVTAAARAGLETYQMQQRSQQHQHQHQHQYGNNNNNNNMMNNYGNNNNGNYFNNNNNNQSYNNQNYNNNNQNYNGNNNNNYNNNMNNMNNNNFNTNFNNSNSGSPTNSNNNNNRPHSLLYGNNNNNNTGSGNLNDSNDPAHLAFVAAMAASQVVAQSLSGNNSPSSSGHTQNLSPHQNQQNQNYNNNYGNNNSFGGGRQNSNTNSNFNRRQTNDPYYRS